MKYELKIKQILTIAFIAITPISLFAQHSQIEQSSPFERLLLSMDLDSTNLFMNSFSNRIIDGEYDEDVWVSRLHSGKEKFEKRFGIFQLSDFTYDYEKKESILVVFFKNEEEIRMRVIKEEGIWKLDEK